MQKVTFIYSNGKTFTKSGITELAKAQLKTGKKVIVYKAARILKGDAAKSFVPEEVPTSLDGVTTRYEHHYASFDTGEYAITINEVIEIDIADSNLAFIVYAKAIDGNKTFSVVPVCKRIKPVDFADAFKLANLLD